MYDKMTIAAIGVLCSKYDVPLEWALGLGEVEAAGRAFWTVSGRQMPAINLEDHYFYKYLSGAKRDTAVKRGLASKNNTIPVPNSFNARYDLLGEWIAIDRDAALMSISMGVGQVMGAHYERLGYTTVLDMWEDAQSSLAGQVEIMLRFVTTDPQIMKAIKANDYTTVARLYNGPAYKRNSYHTKIKSAVQKYRTGTFGKYRTGTFGRSYTTTEELAAIKALGYETVEKFQRARGLIPDGIIGPITRDEIAKAQNEKSAATKITATKVGTGVLVGGGTIEAVRQGADQIEAVKPVINTVQELLTTSPNIAILVIGLVLLAAAGYGVYRFVQKRKANAV